MSHGSLVCTEEVAYKTIRQRILDGGLPSGARLVHRTLAKDLGMSPNPVVLALRMLERDGLIANTPGLGACVRNWTRNEIEDLYHIRAHQEALAARLCAQRASQDELAKVAAANERFKTSLRREDVEANIRADVALHLAVVAGAHSPDLQRIVENFAIMQCSMKAFGANLGVTRVMSPDVQDVHDALVAALTERKPKLAERRAREHVEQSLKRSMPWILEIAEVLGD